MRAPASPRAPATWAALQQRTLLLAGIRAGGATLAFLPKGSKTLSGVRASAKTLDLSKALSAVPLRGQRRFGRHARRVISFCFPFNCAG
jgi:hypothetical protein